MKMNYSTQHPLTRKWTGAIDEWEIPISLNEWVNVLNFQHPELKKFQS